MNTIKLNIIGEGPAKAKAQEGGSGGGGNKYTYYDISGLSEEDKVKAMDYAYIAKEREGDDIYYDCMGLKYRENYIAGIIAIGVDLSALVGGSTKLETIQLMSIRQASEGFFDNLPQITAEEFYEGTPVETPPSAN